MLTLRYLKYFQTVSACRTHLHRSFRTVLGIETSCDDTGAAVVDENGNILSDVLCSQHQIHYDNGGIIPPLARLLHQRNIKDVVNSALIQSNIGLKDISAIATTVKPGLILSLSVGLEHSKELVHISGKPFIPIHHMEAHSLIVRMTEFVDFPFLVLLASGGHCQIAVVENVDKFLLLGTTVDSAPGEALDKVARRLKLRNLPECSSMSGGQSIEHIGKYGNPKAYDFSLPLYKYRTCNFSFSSLNTEAEKQILIEEERNGIIADGLLPNINDFCASVLYTVARQLVRSVQRAMIFCERTNIIPEHRRCLVFSGGVACNKYIRTVLDSLCVHNDWELVCPPHKLCNDNGVMIAWNGMERLSADIGVMKNAEEVKVLSRCPLGIDISQKVTDANIKIDIFNFHKHLSNNKTEECAAV